MKRFFLVASGKFPVFESLSKTHVSGQASRLGFTLAEVLITLGVVGVVAALTISNLVENYRERQTVVRLKQTYSILSQAFLHMVEENGTLDTWSDNSQEFLKQEFLKHLTVVKSCNDNYWCFANSSGLTHNSGIGFSSYTLNNGVVIGIGTRITNNGEESWGHCFYKIASSQNKGSIHQGRCGSIQVDINGKKGPNKTAQDIFTFYLYADNIIPLGAPIHTSSSWTEDFNRGCISERSLGTCTAWIIYNENMDYLHCPEKLGWGKAMKCK